jgi:hypothetical protein
MSNQYIDPLAKKVINAFKVVKLQTQTFLTNPDEPIHGFCVSGPAGLGKTQVITDSISELGRQNDCSFLSGGHITPIVFYKALYDNRKAGNILVVDDVPILGKNKNEFVPLILGALQNTNRTVSWSSNAAFLKQENIPSSFQTEGKLIYICNQSKSKIETTLKTSNWSDAFTRRFMFAELNSFTQTEKWYYTQYLIVNEMLLAQYSEEVINMTLEFMSVNYLRLTECTPGLAIKSASKFNTYKGQDQGIIEYALEELYAK